MKLKTGSSILIAMTLLMMVGKPVFVLAEIPMMVDSFDPFPPNVPVLLEMAQNNPALAEGLRSFDQGDANKLKESLEAARKINPDFPAVDIMIARLFMTRAQWPVAISILESYVATNPNDAEVYKSFGEVAMVTGRWCDAQLQLEKAFALSQKMSFSPARKIGFNAELLRLRGEVAERRKDFATAAKFYQDLVQYQPNDGYPYWAQGRVKITSGDILGGAELLKKAKLITKTLPQPELAIGMELARNLETKKEAEEWLRKGLKDQETASEANWTQLAQFLINHDRVTEAKLLLAETPKPYEGARDVRLLKAIIHRYLDENDAAEAILSPLYKDNPDDLDCADHLALVLAESADQGKIARAVQISEANLRRAPNLEKLIATAAWVQFKSGSIDIADNMFGQLLRGGRCSSQTAYYAAVLLKARGKPQEANQFMSLAINSDESFPQKAAAMKEIETGPKK